ncbi:single-stranded DNA-binding protein [Streptomyces sp. TRM 70351]|uniref:single-stranded DNA-binding protein n=1 Tax=Streptomyces sp. TRM 70351 TaxID=3116552 RepID=UPI002E7C033F|nr:single-stranded DNA-binding protein [Streptomyces sp. TRM 70351]MEE1928343.1 single-stranded DNA-binding protein [Streptomyces sp. TRM 70351]
MHETTVTVVGNVATKPEFRDAGRAPSVRFRLASTARRFDRERGSWVDGATSFYTVWAWRGLAHNVTACVERGEPLLVHGRLRVHTYEHDGRRSADAVIDAIAIGHDMARGTSAWVRSAPLPADATGVPPGTPAHRSAAPPVPVPAPESVPTG